MMLTSQNGKAARAAFRTLNFGVPAFQSKSGFRTCPNAGQCAKGCYASQGTYRFSNVNAAYQRRLDAITAPDFVQRMAAEIIAQRPVAFRWNDSGDFYSLDYLAKAYAIARLTPTVKHYAYTKQIALVKANPPPENFTLIFSYGGKQDHLINPLRDRHAHIFANLETLKAAQYVDASFDDSQAWANPRHQIGLIYHGANSKHFVTYNQQPTGELCQKQSLAI